MMRLILLLVFLFLPACAFSAELKPNEFTCDDILRFSEDVEQLEIEQLLSLGQAYDKGRCVQQDFARAYGIYRRMVERGSSVAGLRLGYLYLNGLGTDRNIEKARYWFRSKALAGYFYRDQLSDLFLSTEFLGDPVPEMMHQEIKRAREETNGPTEVLMRNYRDLLTGNGVFPENERAIGWLLLAVEKGHPEAYYDLAKRHLSGDGVFKSENSYVVYLTEAARGNHAIAQKELGAFLLQSTTDSIQVYRALVWLLRAQINGLDVTDQVQAAERLLDRKHRKWAREKASEFDFSR